MIAAKMEDGGKRPPSVDDFVYLSDHTYTTEQILDMELAVCTSLGFRLKSITPMHFLERYVLAACISERSSAAPSATPVHVHQGKHQQPQEKLLPIDLSSPILYCNTGRYNKLAMTARYLLELMLVETDFVSGLQCPSSKVTAAAIYLSRMACLGGSTTTESDSDNASDSDCVWTNTLEYYTQYSKESLHGIVLILLEIWRTAETRNEHGVFNKYSKTAYLKVALRPVPSAWDLGF
jgi:hypothetical protein